MKPALFIIQGLAAQTGSAIRAYQRFCQQHDYTPVVLFHTTPDRAQDAKRLQLVLQRELPELEPAKTLGVFVFGGDGTVNFAAQQLVICQLPVELMLVPLGTGNDCARRYGIDNWEWLLQQPAVITEPLRVGRVNDQVFVNSAGLALSADLVKSQSARQKQRYGKFSYVMAALRWLLKPRAIALGVNQQAPKRVLLLSVGVGAYCGGGIRLHPYCERPLPLEQGLSVVCVGQVPRWKHIGYLVAVLLGKHQQLSAVTMYSTNSLTLQPAPGVTAEAIEVDGDLLTQLPAQFSVQETQIQMVRPARIKSAN
ncbi:MAG: diacylglycerol kinase family protein [Idiomarina sp.]